MMPIKKKKIYVLDTSVILHSHDSIMNFEENDIGIPITVLEELDHMKKGNDIIKNPIIYLFPYIQIIHHKLILSDL